MFGVCDGHGTAGREVSTFVKYALPIAVEEGLNDELDEIKQILTDAFESVHESVRENVASSELSGSTCCLTLIHGHKIYSANCGDSRAILVNRQRKITVLTNDHKVDVEIEKKRIIASGGSVH